MAGNADVSSVEPVANPDLSKGKRQRLIRMTKEQVAGRSGPVRQIRRKDQIVSPLALELECRMLLQRAQRAIATIVTSSVYAGDLRAAVEEPVLRQHEWQIAVALRDITELLLDLVSGYAGGTAGPMTTAVLLSQNRAISIARDATTARVLALELLAAQVAAAEAARRDWETAHRMAANNDKYLDLVARTAADQHATMEISDLAEEAGRSAQAFRETLQQATLAAEALALPEPGLPDPVDYSCPDVKTASARSLPDSCVTSATSVPSGANAAIGVCPSAATGAGTTEAGTGMRTPWDMRRASSMVRSSLGKAAAAASASGVSRVRSDKSCKVSACSSR